MDGIDLCQAWIIQVNISSPTQRWFFSWGRPCCQSEHGAPPSWTYLCTKRHNLSGVFMCDKQRVSPWTKLDFFASTWAIWQDIAPKLKLQIHTCNMRQEGFSLMLAWMKKVSKPIPFLSCFLSGQHFEHMCGCMTCSCKSCFIDLIDWTIPLSSQFLMQGRLKGHANDRFFQGVLEFFFLRIILVAFFVEDTLLACPM